MTISTPQEALLPCPFCGCTTINRIFQEKGVEWCQCDWCDTVGPLEGLHDGDMEGWNLRAAQVQPAPVAVEIKTLDWTQCGRSYRAPAPLFGHIRVEDYASGKWSVLWSAPGICDTFTPGVFETPEAAKAAAQADYAARILSAVNARPVAEVQAEAVAGALSELDALRVELNALRVEAEKAFGADEEIAKAWDAIGTRGNPRVLSLPEQISSIIRELDAALDALARRDAETRAKALRDIAEPTRLFSHGDPGVLRGRALAALEARILPAITTRPIAQVQAETVAGAYAAAQEAASMTRHRLEMIADKAWNGDARDFKRLIPGFFDELDNLTPADTQAALARRDAETRAKALREAMTAVSRAAWKHNGDDSYSAGLEDGARKQNEADIDAILALIKEPAHE